MRHDRFGLLSMAHMGPDTNSSHFSILQAPAPHLNGSYTIFGELVSGRPVAERINRLSVGPGGEHLPENIGVTRGVVIAHTGMLRQGTIEPDLWDGVPDDAHFSNNPRPEYQDWPRQSAGGGVGDRKPR